MGASPGWAPPSTPPRGACRTALVERDDFASGTSSKSSKLIHGGLRYLQQGDVRLVYEGLAERQRLRHNAPHLVRILPVHDPDPHPRRGDERQAGPGLRLGAVDVRPDRRGPDRQAPPPAQEGRGAGAHADPAGRAAGLRLPLLRRPGRRRPALPDRGPHRRRARRRGAQRRRGRRPAQGTRPGHRRAGRRRRRRGGRRRDRCRERRGGLGRRGPRPRRGHQSRLHPAGQGDPPHRPVGEGAQRHRRRDPGPEGQAQPVRRAVGRLHLRGHHRHGLRRPHRRSAVHPGGPRVRAAGAERVRVDRCDRGRRDRHVGRPASARQERAVRPHGRPLAPPQGGRLARRAGERDRRQAHDLPAHGRGRGRHGHGSAGPQGALEDQAAAPPRR